MELEVWEFIFCAVIMMIIGALSGYAAGAIKGLERRHDLAVQADYWQKRCLRMMFTTIEIGDQNDGQIKRLVDLESVAINAEGASKNGGKYVLITNNNFINAIYKRGERNVT